MNMVFIEVKAPKTITNGFHYVGREIDDSKYLSDQMVTNKNYHQCVPKMATWKYMNLSNLVIRVLFTHGIVPTTLTKMYQNGARKIYDP